MSQGLNKTPIYTLNKCYFFKLREKFEEKQEVQCLILSKNIILVLESSCSPTFMTRKKNFTFTVVVCFAQNYLVYFECGNDLSVSMSLYMRESYTMRKHFD